MDQSQTSTTGVNLFPKQKISEKEKYADDNQYFKRCASWLKNFAYYASYHNQHRIPLTEMWALENAHFGEVDTNDYNKIFNPSGNPAITAMIGEITNFPVELANFKILVSETTKRPRKNGVKVLNIDYKNQENEAKIDDLYNELASKLQSGAPLNDVNQTLNNKDNFYKMSYRDAREKQYTDLLTYHSNVQRFDIIEQKTILDKILFGEQHVLQDIVNGNPVITKLDPKYLYYSSAGLSNKVQDSDRISVVSYAPLSKICDIWREDLTDAQIDELESKWSYYMGVGQTLVDVNGLKNPNSPGVVNVNDIDGRMFNSASSNLNTPSFLSNSLTSGQYMGSNATGDSVQYAPVDKFGNIRIMRCFWKGLKKYKKVKKIGDNGEEINFIMSNRYESDDETYEEIESTWIPAWYETTIIGDSMFIDMKEWEGNAYTSDGYELCTAPVIGYSQSHNNQNAESIMKRIKFHKMFYNLIKHELKQAIGSNVGNVLELDFSKFPVKMAGFSVDKHLARIKSEKINIVDPTNVINEGSAANMLSGAFNTTGRVQDWSQVSHIQLYQMLADQIKKEIDEISGVSEIRKGTTTAQTVGATERNMMQTAMNTEIFYKENDDFWACVLNNFIELCKVAYRTKKPRFFSATDDISASLYDFNVDEFVNLDLGVIVTDTSEEEEIKTIIKQNAANMMINGNLDILELVRIMKSKSLALMEAVLQKSQEEKQEQAMQQQKSQEELQQKMQQMQADEAERQRQFEIEMESLRADGKIEVQRLASEASIEAVEIKVGADQNGNGIMDSVEREKIIAQREKSQQDYRLRLQEMQQKYNIENKKLNQPTKK